MAVTRSSSRRSAGDSRPGRERGRDSAQRARERLGLAAVLLVILLLMVTTPAPADSGDGTVRGSFSVEGTAVPPLPSQRHQAYVAFASWNGSLAGPFMRGGRPLTLRALVPFYAWQYSPGAPSVEPFVSVVRPNTVQPIIAGGAPSAAAAGLAADGYATSPLPPPGPTPAYVLPGSPSRTREPGDGRDEGQRCRPSDDPTPCPGIENG